MNTLFKGLAGLLLSAVLSYSFNLTDSGMHQNAPEDSIYYSENNDGSESVTLYEDEIYFYSEKRDVEYIVEIQDVEDVRRKLTKIYLKKFNGEEFTINFWTIMEAKKLTEKIEELL